MNDNPQPNPTAAGEPSHCPTCQAPIPTDAPGGFCPACVLRDACESGASVPLAAAPTLEEISAAFPQWEILSLIGQGGMGFVYKIRQPDLDRIVALKILAPILSQDPAFAERFAREARTLAKLHHPNIVTIFEHGKAASGTRAPLYYLLMEYVDGVNLRQALQAGRFTPEQALAIVPGICDALQTAHTQGILHRDIKPENILLDRHGNVKIADFGIARIVASSAHNFTLTRTGNQLGSTAYMAPEQHEKPHDIDHRADIYSLGVVIYEMLTGELPLGRFPLPSQRAAVGDRIDEIVLRTLEKERHLRQQSANEVKTEVQGAGNGQPLPSITSKKKSSNKPILIGCGVLALIVLLPLLVVLLFFYSIYSAKESFATNVRDRAEQQAKEINAKLFNQLPSSPPMGIEPAECEIQFWFYSPSDKGNGKSITHRLELSEDWWTTGSLQLESGDMTTYQIRARVDALHPETGEIAFTAQCSQESSEQWETQSGKVTKQETTKELRLPNGIHIKAVWLLHENNQDTLDAIVRKIREEDKDPDDAIFDEMSKLELHKTWPLYRTASRVEIIAQEGNTEAYINEVFGKYCQVTPVPEASNQFDLIVSDPDPDAAFHLANHLALNAQDLVEELGLDAKIRAIRKAPRVSRKGEQFTPTENR